MANVYNKSLYAPKIVQWDGAYKEISSGYTVTINTPPLNSTIYTYSIDGGLTYNQFTSSPTVLENVTQIKFKQLASAYEWHIGTTEGGYEFANMYSNESENIEVTQDLVLYSWTIGGGGGN